MVPNRTYRSINEKGYLKLSLQSLQRENLFSLSVRLTVRLLLPLERIKYNPEPNGQFSFLYNSFIYFLTRLSIFLTSFLSYQLAFFLSSQLSIFLASFLSFQLGFYLSSKLSIFLARLLSFQQAFYLSSQLSIFLASFLSFQLAFFQLAMNILFSSLTIFLTSFLSFQLAFYLSK